jgi:hypothetical protein
MVGAAAAAPLRPEDVPPALKPWVPWALAGHETETCPPMPEGGGLCRWSGRLDIAVDARGGRFRQTWWVEAEVEVPLPGSRDHWPLDVRVGARKIVVLERDGVPLARLQRGQHDVTGTFSWSRVPEVLPIPATTGLLGLTVAGREVPFPRRTEEGQLFLATTTGETRPETEADTLEVGVYRKLTDDVPLLLTTRIDLAVTGKPREVVLAAPLPAGFVAQALETRLPTRLDPDGKLRVQLRPGQHTLSLIARAPVLPAAITRPQPDGLWKAGDEIWAFEARPELRLVTLSGVAAVDTRQSKLPDEWRSLPAYLVPVGAAVKLEQRRRGDAEPAPDRLSLQRTLWLDFEGRGYTVRDRLSGRLERSQRLEMAPGQHLARFVVAGVDQPITQLSDGPAGVEVRDLDLQAIAEARIEEERVHPPAVGWAHDFQSVQATLALPPGWRLFHAMGVDRVDDSFVRRLSLLDLFLVLVVALGAGRLFGFKIGVLAFCVMALLTKETGAPTWIWLAVLVGEALVRGLPAGYLRKAAKVYRLSITLVLAVMAFPFALVQVNRALHPTLGHAGGGDDTSNIREEQVVVADSAPAPPRRRVKSMAGKAEAPRAQKPSEPAAENDILAEAVGAEQMRALGGLSGIGQAGGGVANLAAPPPQAPAPAAKAEAQLDEYDPNAEVQTGPGIPKWSGTEIALGWNGPVERGARLTLWLIPPWLESVLGGLRVVLMSAFIVLLLRGALASFGRFMPPVVTGVGLLFALMLGNAAPAAADDLPPKELLEELRTRLSRRPECAPDCASFGRLSIEAAGNNLRLRLEADALAASGVGLPGLAQQWSPATVSVDGKPAVALHRDNGGRLWLLLAPGAHQVVMEGPIGNRTSVQIPFGRQRPHVVTAALRGFELLGVAEDGAVRDTLELVRGAGATAGDRQANDDAAPTLPPFVFVERTLSLGLEWRVHTEIVRGSPTGTAVVTEVALLPGEAVLTPGIKVAGGKVQVNMGPDEASSGWDSTLQQRSPITLKAPAAEAAGLGTAEVWRLDAGPLWHVRTTGIPPAHPEPAAARRVHLWRPWPGESVALEVSRPGGLKSDQKGQTLTLDESTLELSPGARSTDAKLTLFARTSRGLDHTLHLPEGATLTALSIDGREQPVRQEGRKVVVPLAPGRQRIELGFRSGAGLGLVTRAPEVDLGAPAVNLNVQMQLSADRWILWAFGPRLGPAVLLPSMILVVLVLGLALGRARLLPLRTHQFVLLGLGFLPLSLGAAAAVLGYLVALSWRRTHLRTRQAWLHDLVQLVLAVWTVLAIAILFLVVREGLLSSPDMEVVGNGSSESLLRWTIDRSAGPTPAAGVISLPLGAYHLTMLAWGLWLAAALIRWAPWVWSCLTAGGLWRPLFPPRKIDPSPEPPPSETPTEKVK